MRLLNGVLLALLLISFGSFASAEQYYEFEYNVVRAYEGTWDNSVPYFVPNPAQTEPTVFPTTFYFYEITHNITAFEGLKYIIVFPSPYPNLNYGRYYFVEAFNPLEIIDESGNHWIYSKAAAEWGGSLGEIIIKINADGTPDFSEFVNSNSLDGVSSTSSAPITLGQAIYTYRCFEQTIPFNPNPTPPPVAGIGDCQYATVMASQPISELREIDRVVIGKTLKKYLHKWTGWNEPLSPPTGPVSTPPVVYGTGGNTGATCENISFEYPSQVRVGDIIQVGVTSPVAQSSGNFRVMVPGNSAVQVLQQGNSNSFQGNILVPNNVGENITLRFSSDLCALSTKAIPILPAISIQEPIISIPQPSIQTPVQSETAPYTNLFKRSYKKLPPFPYKINVPENGFYSVEGYEGTYVESLNVDSLPSSEEKPFGFYYFYYNGDPFFVFDDGGSLQLLTPLDPIEEVGGYIGVGFSIKENKAISRSQFLIELNDDNFIFLGKSLFSIPANDYGQITPPISDTRGVCFMDYKIPGQPFTCTIMQPRVQKFIPEVPLHVKDFVNMLERLDPKNFIISNNEIMDLNGFILSKYLEKTSENILKKSTTMVEKKDSWAVVAVASMPVKGDEEKLLTNSIKSNEIILYKEIKLIQGNRMIISNIHYTGKIFGVFPISFTYGKEINVHTKQETDKKPWWAFFVLP